MVRHYLCKHGLPVLGDHGALITVQGDAGVVEGLLGVLEDVVELGDAALEHRAEVAGDQRPADGCGGGGDRKKVDSFHTQAANTVLMERPRLTRSFLRHPQEKSPASAAQFTPGILRGYLKVRRRLATF